MFPEPPALDICTQIILFLVIFCHVLSVIRTDVIFLHEILMKNTLKEIQGNNADCKKNEW